MDISRFFIDRPRFAAVLSIFIFLLGALAIFRLPVSEYPEVAPPQIVVRAQFPGANPRVISETVATPLEEQINGIENLLYFDSQGTADGAMTLTLSSFGFARGMPPLADLVFDMRFLDNPHWVPALREQTGQDAAVGEHIERDPAFAEAFERIRGLLLMLLPRYARQGKPYVHIAFGCTGGRHRSVYTAETTAEALRGAGFSP
ncbi:MAG: hypothetical protein EAZ21_09410, partial [Betaproteobacteria bacterium]